MQSVCNRSKMKIVMETAFFVIGNFFKAEQRSSTTQIHPLAIFLLLSTHNLRIFETVLCGEISKPASSKSYYVSDSFFRNWAFHFSVLCARNELTLFGQVKRAVCLTFILHPFLASLARPQSRLVEVVKGLG